MFLNVFSMKEPEPEPEAPKTNGAYETIIVSTIGKVGLITLNRMKTVPPEERASTSLRRAACPPEEIPLAAPDEPLDELLPRLSGCTDGRALVFDGDHLAGIVSPSDISRAVALRGLGVEFAPGAGSDTGRGTVV